MIVHTTHRRHNGLMAVHADSIVRNATVIRELMIHIATDEFDSDVVHAALTAIDTERRELGMHLAALETNATTERGRE